MVDIEPKSVAITLDTLAKIMVFLSASNSLSALGPVKMALYASNENPLAKLKLLLLVKLNTIITMIGKYNTASNQHKCFAHKFLIDMHWAYLLFLQYNARAQNKPAQKL